MSELKKIDPLSHSKTASYSNCERKFSFNYLESIKEPSGIHAAVGTYVHSVIENFYNTEKAQNLYLIYMRIYGKSTKGIFPFCLIKKKQK